MNNLEITCLEDLKIMGQGEIVELPPFILGKKFVARVKKPSLLNLIKRGCIPNKLLGAAEELFYGKQSSEGINITQLTEVMFIMAENALVEPSIEELKESGLELTDEQMVALFNYTQRGIEELESFRNESKDFECNSNK